MKFKKVIKSDLEDIKSEAEEAINGLEDTLNEAIDYCNQIEDLFDQLGIHSADIAPYMTNYLDDMIGGGFNVSIEEFRKRLEERFNSDYNEED